MVVVFLANVGGDGRFVLNNDTRKYIYTWNDGIVDTYVRKRIRNILKRVTNELG